MMSEKLYKIEEHPICGRQLIARRKILSGELIIDEPALLAEPGFARGDAGCHQMFETRKCQRKSFTTTELKDFIQEDASVCLVCCANLSSSSYVRCPSCGLFLCSDKCKSHDQHTQNECIVFPKIRHVWKKKPSRSKKSLYNLVLVVRGLYYKFRDVTKWIQINTLDSKLQALEKIEAFADLEDVLRSLQWDMFVSSSCSASAKQENYDNFNSADTTENIFKAAQHCLGVMRINAFSSFSESYNREALFFISSFMSHSCIINTDRQIGSTEAADVRMVVRASVDIQKDEPITTTYLSLLYNTEERHRIMISSWLFVCKCKRCEDPMECQTFSSTIICQDQVGCQEKILEKIIVARPTNLYDITNVEQWLDSHDTGQLIHPNHSLFAHIKLFLCQFYGRQKEGLEKLSISQLKRKVTYCFQILQIFDRICPGIQMCRGVVIFEMWNGLQKLLELNELPFTIMHDFKQDTSISSSPMPDVTILSETDISELKKKALAIFQYALPNTPENAMASCLLEED